MDIKDTKCIKGKHHGFRQKRGHEGYSDGYYCIYCLLEVDEDEE